MQKLGEMYYAATLCPTDPGHDADFFFERPVSDLLTDWTSE